MSEIPHPPDSTSGFGCAVCVLLEIEPICLQVVPMALRLRLPVSPTTVTCASIRLHLGLGPPGTPGCVAGLTPESDVTKKFVTLSLPLSMLPEPDGEETS